MRIGLSVDALAPQMSGIGRYTWELCQGLGRCTEITDLSYYCNAELIRDPRNLLVPHARRKYILPGSLRRLKAREKLKRLLFHGTNYFLPEYADGGVVTVHDLSVLLHPETHPIERIRQFERNFERTLLKASHIITDSEMGKQEFIAYSGCDPLKVSAISLGVSPAFRQRDRLACQIRVGKLLGREISDYVLSVAAFEPRKRIGNAIRAHAKMCRQTGRSIPLVLVGANGWENDDLHELIEAEERNGLLIFAKFVPDEELPTFYSGASLFVYPSIYEGFGLPPIEAMASGVPVLTSNRSCLPEVTKGAACYTNPDDIDQFAASMERCLVDDAWRLEAIRAGLEVAADYKWEHCISKTIEVYRSVLGI